jgi:ABC-type branched-subunit amino acid transport system substrate-binding protein
VRRAVATVALLASWLTAPCARGADPGVPILVPNGGSAPASPPPAAAAPAQAPAAVAPVPAPAAGPPAIGVLLPLSGRYQSFGESCLRGIRVALGAIEGRTPAVRTVILDTRGDPAGAATEFQKLAADPSVAVVLGPMLAGEVDAIQTYVHGFGLATFNFSQRPIATGGPLFRFTLTKEDQARVLARYAVGELGLRRWAAFHPEDAYGREISADFRRAAETNGGRVVADVGYEPGKNDLQSEAKRLQAKLGIAENQPPPIDGVFLPDSADRLPVLSSYLTFVDIRGVQLLGASGWDRPQTLLAAGPAVNGAVFVDGFFLYSFRPEVRAFVDAYRDAYHNDPGTLEAYGYDIATWMRQLVAAGATRAQLLAELRRPIARRGATGESVFFADGRIEQGLFVLRIEDGTIREIETTAATVLNDAASPRSSAPSDGWRRPEWDSRSVEERVGH